jgi:hypothetical protein
VFYVDFEDFALTTAETMKEFRGEHAVVSLGGKSVLAVGGTDGRPLSSCEILTADGWWHSGTDLPHPTTSVGACVLSGEVLISGLPHSNIFRYCLSTSTVKTMSVRLPSP